MSRNLSKEFTGVLFVLFSAFFYATLPILCKFAYGAGLTPTSTLLLRYIFSFIFFVIYLGVFIKAPLVCKSPWVIVQCLLMVLSGLFFFGSLEYLSACLTSVIFFLYPIFVSVIAIFVYKERCTMRLVISLILAFLGIVLISGLGQESIQISVKGMIYSLLSSITYSVYIILGQKNLTSVSPLTFTSTLSLIAIVAFTGVNYRDLSFIYSLTLEQILIMISITIFATILSIVFLMKGLQKIGASKASLVSTVEPVFTILMAFVILGEKLTITEFLGSLLVIVGMLLAVLAQDKKAKVTGNTDASTEEDSSPNLAKLAKAK